MPKAGIKLNKKPTMLVIAWLFLISSNLSLADKELPPGVIGSLKELIDNSRDKIKKEYQNLRSASKIELNPSVDLVKSSKINSEFMRSIFLHSEKRFLKLISLNHCHLYALMENKLLKSSLGEVEFLIMTKQTNENFLIRYDQYLENIFKYKCQNFSQFSKIFNDQNLRKTVLSLNFSTPKTEDDCSSILKDWSKNDYLPYLCKIPYTIKRAKRAKLIKASKKSLRLSQTRLLNEVIRKGQFYQREIPFFERSYLENMCAGLQRKANFCEPYLSRDAWSMVLNGELDRENLSIRCNNLLKRSPNSKISQDQLLKCASKLKNSKEVCTTKGSKGFSSLFPKPNCSLISMALQKARLFTPYQDCPGLIDNAAITNIHRLLAHHLDFDILSTQDSCQAEANYTLAKLNSDGYKKQEWPLQICYFDKIENKEICNPYIPGNLPKSKMAEGKVVTKSVKRLAALGQSKECRVVSEAQFNPALLEYKNGCFVVFDQNNCSNAYCPKKIIIDEKPIEGIVYKGIASFDYFPNNWRDAKKSALMLMQENYKLSGKKIRNLTELEVYLRKYPNAVLHGVGCAEDILPHFFKRKSFNFCSPLPFIIDGLIRKNENMILVTRTGIDDVHSPRLIPWNWIFTGVMKYTSLHPLKQWNLHGLKK